MTELLPPSPAERIGNTVQAYGGKLADFVLDAARVALVSNPAYSYLAPHHESEPMAVPQEPEIVRKNQPLVLRGGGIYRGGNPNIIHRVRFPNGERGQIPMWRPADSAVREQKRVAWEAKTATLPSLWNTPEKYMQQAADLGWEVVESEYGGRPELYATVNMGEDPSVEDTMAKLRQNVFETTGGDLRAAGEVRSKAIRKGSVALNLTNLWTPEREIKLGNRSLPGIEVLELMTDPKMIQLMRERQLPSFAVGGALISYIILSTPIFELSESKYLQLSPVNFESTDRTRDALTCLPSYKNNPTNSKGRKS